MNEVLLDSVRHNCWATAHLIRFCQDQDFTAEQLEVTGVGTYGGILATLDHIVRCDGSYLRRLAQTELDFVDSDEQADLARLAEWTEQTRVLWEETLAKPIDTERVIVIDDETRETRAGIFIAQSLNHANHHREQVCAVLTGFGLEPPDIQAWEYAWHTHRIWDR
ncbi:putative damage-inducible protein DinB [Kribbella amoyensis]|uniref:Putative damage-inducible protein DinB n=1 Tax=Kribbella amoyensis TaxID=996641 RepID=A0A561BM94_9ACTN|nr:DinB family protein [Kribbella amoyensis]TWD79994.1 putative damage-inducible protein DinB [Kribbella amoyensis]